MTNNISSLAPMTELDAINLMLSVIGEQPLPDANTFNTSTSADVILATDIIRKVAVEVQSMGWRFNREWAYRLNPSSTYTNWTDLDGTVIATLNIFTPPANLIHFEISQDILKQSGTARVDIVLRPPDWQSNAPPGSPPARVFYDRGYNRPGLDNIYFPALYIDAVWLWDFAVLPELARKFISIRAAREFQQRVVGSQELNGFSEADERVALRNLRVGHGEQDDYNMLDNFETLAALGFRPRNTGVVAKYGRRRL